MKAPAPTRRDRPKQSSLLPTLQMKEKWVHRL